MAIKFLTQAQSRNGGIDMIFIFESYIYIYNVTVRSHLFPEVR